MLFYRCDFGRRCSKWIRPVLLSDRLQGDSTVGICSFEDPTKFFERTGRSERWRAVPILYNQHPKEAFRDE